MKPIFALGKTNERSESGSLSAGTKTIAVTNASTYFSVGDPIFVSEANGTEVEYLGEATAVDSSTVTVSYALVEAKGPGYKVWKPTYHVLMPYDISSPYDKLTTLGVQTQRTQSGIPYRTRIADPYTIVTLTWEKLPASALASLDFFIIIRLNYGIEKCTIGFYDYKASRAYSVTATLLIDELPYTEPIPHLAPLEIPFQIDLVGAYQS